LVNDPVTGRSGYTGPGSQGRILPSGTVNKIMGGDLMVRNRQNSSKNNIA
jgi:hypothetical protein